MLQRGRGLACVVVSILIAATLSADKRWEQTPSSEWEPRDVGWILLESPWIDRDGRHVLNRTGTSDLRSEMRWVQFIWLSEPVMQGLERADELIRLNPSLRQFTSTEAYYRDMQRLLAVFPGLKRWTDGRLEDRRSIFILVSASSLGEVTRETGDGALPEVVLRNDAGLTLPSINAAFGSERRDNEGDAHGMGHAVVSIAELRKMDAGSMAGKAPVDAVPPYFPVTFRSCFSGLHNLQWILLEFPRGNSDPEGTLRPFGKATVEISVAGTVLKARFSLDKMVFDGRSER